MGQSRSARRLDNRQTPQPNTVVELAAARITDWPSFRVRGMHVHGLNKLMTDTTMNFYLQADRMSVSATPPSSFQLPPSLYVFWRN